MNIDISNWQEETTINIPPKILDTIMLGLVQCTDNTVRRVSKPINLSVYCYSYDYESNEDIILENSEDE